MNLSRSRLVAVGVAALVLVGGVLLLTFPATESVEEETSGAHEVVGESGGEEALEAEVPGTTDYGAMLLKMVISVVIVCALAYVILRWGLRRVVGESSGSENMEVLGRLGIGPERAIMVVRVGSRYLVIGSGETEISILTELSEAEASAFVDTEVTEE